LGREILNEAFMPIVEEKEDPIADLLESNLSSVELIEKVESLFRVRKAHLPPGIKKYRVNEGFNGDTQIPVNARVPGGFNSKSERVLDMYVSAWNKQQTRRGEPYQLSWTPHSTTANMVGFDIQLK